MSGDHPWGPTRDPMRDASVSGKAPGRFHTPTDAGSSPAAAPTRGFAGGSSSLASCAMQVGASPTPATISSVPPTSTDQPRIRHRTGADHRLPSSNGQDTRLSIWGCGFESRWGRHHHVCGHPAGRDLRSKRSARWFDSTMRVHSGHPSGMRRARGAHGRQRRSARRGAGPPDGRHAAMAMHRCCNPERPVRFRGRPPPIRTRKDKPTGDGSGLENRRAMSLGGSTPPPSANRPIPTRVWAIVFCTVPTCDGHV